MPQSGAFGKKGIIAKIDKLKAEELLKNFNHSHRDLWTIFQFHTERSDILSLIEASKLLLSGV
ncbi:MAG: hypothetical protein L3J41_08400 [Melioribacteraceae bacterium]|nr:hypothetical protein [Melioribacteraceae bacterium]